MYCTYCTVHTLHCVTFELNGVKKTFTTNFKISNIFDVFDLGILIIFSFSMLNVLQNSERLSKDIRYCLAKYLIFYNILILIKIQNDRLFKKITSQLCKKFPDFFFNGVPSVSSQGNPR